MNTAATQGHAASPGPGQEPPRAAAPTSAAAPVAGMTARSLLIGLVLVPILSAWNIYSDIVAQSIEMAVLSLSIGVVFALLVLLSINAFLRRRLPRTALSRPELLTIYVMQAATIGISGVGSTEFLITELGNVWGHASSANRWGQKYHHLLARWAFPDPSVLPGFYNGHSTFLTERHVLGWLSPILVWSAFILTMLGVTLCISSLLRRRWVEEERLTFPMVILPLALTDDVERRKLLRSRAFWLGCIVAFGLENLAAFAYIYPGIPHVPIKASEPALQLQKYFTQPPWSAVGELDLAFYPLVIGLTYLLPLDVSCSCWFFYLLNKVENIVATAWGFRDPGASPVMARFPYEGQQGLGGFLGLAILSLWGARGYFRRIWPWTAVAARDEARGAGEPMPYRAAAMGAVAGCAAMLGFGMLLGMSPVVGLGLIGLYLMVVVAYTRIRAEAGLAWAFGPDMTPHQAVIAAGGTAIGIENLIGLTMFQWMDLDYRCTVMPNQIEGMKIASSARMNQRHLAVSIAVASVVAILSSWLFLLLFYYHYGADSGHVDSYRTTIGDSPWQILDSWTSAYQPPDTAGLTAVGVGVGITMLLSAARTRFLWWPLNPIGYVLSGTYTMVWIWCPVFLGWLSKWLILRYGGLSIYRLMLPFFIGLILGDYVAGSIWAIFGCITGSQPYKIAPI